MTKTIAVPVDLGMSTLPVIDAAIELAAALSARVQLLHVREPVPVVVPRGLTETETVEPSETDRLDAVARPLRARGLEVVQSLRDGNPASEIVAHAEEVGADYLILGCHKKGAIERALLGSVSQAVLQNAPCPVLLVDATEIPDDEA